MLKSALYFKEEKNNVIVMILLHNETFSKEGKGVSNVYPSSFKNKTAVVKNLLEIINNALLENGWILLHINILIIYSAYKRIESTLTEIKVN